MNPEIYKQVYKRQSEDEDSEIVQKAIETSNRLKSLGTVKSETEKKNGK